MKKLAILAVLASLSVAASATVFGDSHDTNNINTPTANASSSAGAVGIGQGGEGGKGGAGGSVLGSGNSSNTNLNANLQGQNQAQSSRNTNSNNASGGSSAASAANGGNTISNSIGGDTTVYERSAPGISISAPTQPITSCRLGVSLGGSNTGGAVGGGIPIGNDATCLAGAQLAAMEKAGGFTMDDRQKAACGIEGMSAMSVCKKQAEPAKSAAALAPAAVVASSNEPQDVYVRRRLGLPALK